MFIFFWINSAKSLKPIILVPGTGDSRLEGNFSSKSFWYCPKTTTFLGINNFIPPKWNCLLNSLKLEYDANTKYYRQDENNTIFIPQGYEALKVFKVGAVAVYTALEGIIKALKKKDYVFEKNLYVAPFDWRYGPALRDTYWNKLIAMVETAYENNNQQKVILMTHSLGGYVAQQFLTKYTKAEWRSKFIDSVIMCAPSIGGAGPTIPMLLSGKLPFLGLFFSKKTYAAMRSIGAIHSQLPNAAVYANETLIVIENAEQKMNITGRDLSEFFRESGYVDQELFEVAGHLQQETPVAPDVPVAIVYNSQLKTVKGYDFVKRKTIYGKGDQMINVEGPKYLCSEWSKKTKMICHDVKSRMIWCNHIGMAAFPTNVKHLLHYAFDDSWKY